MCQYSVSAENKRDAVQGEDLVVSQAPHGGSNWITERGKPDCAVCIPASAILAVQVPNQPVRGARFIQRPEEWNSTGNYDFLKFIDGGWEYLALNEIPVGASVRVLLLRDAGQPIPTIPETISRPTDHADDDAEYAEIFVPITGGSSGNRLTEFFGSD